SSSSATRGSSTTRRGSSAATAAAPTSPGSRTRAATSSRCTRRFPELGPDQRRHLGPEQLDRAHHLGVREGADAELDQEALVAEEAVLVDDLRCHLLRVADEVGAARLAAGFEG